MMLRGGLQNKLVLILLLIKKQISFDITFF